MDLNTGVPVKEEPGACDEDEEEILHTEIDIDDPEPREECFVQYVENNRSAGGERKVHVPLKRNEGPRGSTHQNLTNQTSRMNSLPSTTHIRYLDGPTSDRPPPRKKNVFATFIEAYESHDLLWNTTHGDYKNTTKRNRALDDLKAILFATNPDITRQDVRKKINTLRSNYRKELKKIDAFKRSGLPYTPKSWTFEALRFLQRVEGPFSSSQIQNEPQTQGTTEESTEQQTHHAISSTQSIPPPKKKEKDASGIATQIEQLQKACLFLSQRSTNTAFEAAIWAEKLSKVDPTQKIFAEKAINDIIFEAQLGTLNRYSVKINENWSSTSATCTASTQNLSHVQEACEIPVRNSSVIRGFPSKLEIEPFTGNITGSQ